MATKNEMKQEAIKRLCAMGVSKREAEAVIHNGGIRFAVDRKIFEGVRESIQEMFKGIVAVKICEFEKKYNCLSYSVYVQDSWAGTLVNILYVSSYEEDWDGERESLEEARPIAYCINLNVPDYSEFGTMYVEEYKNGFFKRTDI